MCVGILYVYHIISFKITVYPDPHISLHFTDRMCKSKGPPLQNYPGTYNVGTGPRILPSMPIICDGYLTKWTYFAAANGSFVATVWEVLPESANFKLVAKHLIEVNIGHPGIYVSILI